FLISRGQSRRLLKLVMIICPIAIGSYAIGLPFGIRGVALSGTLVMLAIFPWILKFSFHGTTLTLRRLGSRIMYPTAVSLGGVVSGELVSRVTGNLSPIEQILLIGVAYVAGSAVLLIVKPIRDELRELLKLLPSSRMSLSERLAGELD